MNVKKYIKRGGFTGLSDKKDVPPWKLQVEWFHLSINVIPYPPFAYSIHYDILQTMCVCVCLFIFILFYFYISMFGMVEVIYFHNNGTLLVKMSHQKTLFFYSPHSQREIHESYLYVCWIVHLQHTQVCLSRLSMPQSFWFWPLLSSQSTEAYLSMLQITPSFTSMTHVWLLEINVFFKSYVTKQTESASSITPNKWCEILIIKTTNDN